MYHCFHCKINVYICSVVLSSKYNNNSQWCALVMNAFSTQLDSSHANEDIDTKMTDQENFTLQHCQNYQSAKAHLSFKTNHLTKPKIQSPSLFSHSGHFSNNGMCFTTFSVAGFRQAKAPQYVQENYSRLGLTPPSIFRFLSS